MRDGRRAKEPQEGQQLVSEAGRDFSGEGGKARRRDIQRPGKWGRTLERGKGGNKTKGTGEIGGIIGEEKGMC